MKDEDILSEAKERYNLATEGWEDIYNESKEDLRFTYEIADGQWPAAVRQQRKGRPMITVNKLQKFVRQLRGDFMMNRPSMKVIPVDDKADPIKSELYNGLIRQIEYTSNAPIAYDTAYGHAVAGGIGFWRIYTEYSGDDTFNQDIKIQRVLNPHSIHFDPFAVDFNFEDAQYCFAEELIDKKDFERIYKADAIDFDGISDDLIGSWVADGKIRIAEYFKKDPIKKHLMLFQTGEVGELTKEFTIDYYKSLGLIPLKERTVDTHLVRWYKMTGVDILEETVWAGMHIPIIPMFGDEVVVDGKRTYLSLIRGAKGSQQMYNYWASAATENLMLTPKTPFLVDHRQVKGFEKEWEDANIVPRMYLRYNAVAGLQKPYREPQTQIPAAIVNMMQTTSFDIEDHLGRYESSKGEAGNERSGKAILARIAQSDKGTFTFVDNAARSIIAGLKQIVELIPKIYDTPRALNILGENGERGIVNVNQPSPEGGEDINDLKVGKFDVIATIGTSGSRREEMVKGLMEAAQYAPDIAPIIVPLIIKNSDWPGAQEIYAEIMKYMQQQQQAQPAQTP